jgi:hypothetical protein
MQEERTRKIIKCALLRLKTSRKREGTMNAKWHYHVKGDTVPRSNQEVLIFVQIHAHDRPSIHQSCINSLDSQGFWV